MMTDIRQATQDALDAVFYQLDVYVGAEEYIGDGPLPEEYILYSVVSEDCIHYADNKPFSIRSNVDVIYFCRDISMKMSRVPQIISAMTTGGFALWSGGRDIAREPEADVFGVTMEFALCRGVYYGEST